MSLRSKCTQDVEVKQGYEIEKVIWTLYQSIFVSFHKSIKVSVNLSLVLVMKIPLSLMIKHVHLIDCLVHYAAW